MFAKLLALFTIASVAGMGVYAVSGKKAEPPKDHTRPVIIPAVQPAPMPVIAAAPAPIASGQKFALTAYQGGMLVGPNTLYVKGSFGAFTQTVAVNRVGSANAWISAAGVRIGGPNGLYQGFWMVGKTPDGIWLFSVDSSGNAPYCKRLSGTENPVSLVGDSTVAADGLGLVIVSETP